MAGHEVMDSLCGGDGRVLDCYHFMLVAPVEKC